MDVRGDTVKRLRASRGWSQQHLADACDVNLRTIQRVERFGVAAPETAIALAAAFDVEHSGIIISRDAHLLRLLPESNLGIVILFFTISFFGAFCGASLMFWFAS